MTTDQIIALAGVVTTIIVGVISWFVSAHFEKKNQMKKEIKFNMKMEPILSKAIHSEAGDLKIEYKGELLDEPVLLSVDIVNSGNVALENPPIEIEAVGTTYVIPGYIEDVPVGYEHIWEIERTDAESCAIKLEHINPGQIVKARFLLDEFPTSLPHFKCPMKDLTVKMFEPYKPNSFVSTLLEIIQPGILQVLKY